MSSVVAQAGPALPAPFRLVFLLVPLLVAGLALVVAAFPRRMTRWQLRGPDGATHVESSRTHILVIRVGGVVVAAIALGMALGAHAILP